MAFSFAAPTITDKIKDYVASFVSKTVSIINAFPGGNLVDASVTNAKLAKAKALFSKTLVLNGGATLLVADTASVAGWRVPYIDGASSATFRITGWSFHVTGGTAGTAVTLGANNQLFVKVNGVTQITIDINAADAHGNTLAAGTPIQSAAAMALVTLTSGQRVTVDYDYGGTAASYPNPELHLEIAVVHVSGV